jgi:hypothetical protein
MDYILKNYFTWLHGLLLASGSEIQRNYNFKTISNFIPKHFPKVFLHFRTFYCIFNNTITFISQNFTIKISDLLVLSLSFCVWFIRLQYCLLVHNSSILFCTVQILFTLSLYAHFSHIERIISRTERATAENINNRCQYSFNLPETTP